MRRTCFWLAPLLLAGFAAASLAQDPAQEPQPEPHLALRLPPSGWPHVRWSPAGDVLALGATSVTLLDLAAGEARGQLHAASPMLVGLGEVVWHPDGSQVVSRTEERRLVVWSAATARPLRAIELAEPVAGAAWAPDGATLAVAHGGKVSLWDPTSGQRRAERALYQQPLAAPLWWLGRARTRTCVFGPEDVHRWDPYRPLVLAWSPEGRRLAVLAEARLLVFEASGAEAWQRELPAGQLLTLLESACNFATPPPLLSWSPDGELLVAGGKTTYVLDGADGEVRAVFALPEGRVEYQSPLTGERQVAEFPRLPSPPLHPAALLGVSIRGRGDPVEPPPPRLTTQFFSQALWSPAGDALVLVSNQGAPLLAERSGRVRGWLLTPLQEDVGVTQVRWLPDEDRVATLRGAELRVWDTRTVSLVGRYELPVVGRARANQPLGPACHTGPPLFSWSPDGRWLVVPEPLTPDAGEHQSPRRFALWAAASGERRFELEPTETLASPPLSYVPAPEHFQWSPDSSFVAWWAFRGDGGFLVWEADSGRLRSVVPGAAAGGLVPLLGPRGGWNAAGDTIAARVSGRQAGQNTVLFLDTATGAPRSHFDLPVISQLELSPDGAWLAMARAPSAPQSVTLFAPATGERVTLPDHRERIARLIWSPAGDLLAVRTEPGRLFMWEVPAGRLLGVLERVPQYVVWSPDGAAFTATQPQADRDEHRFTVWVARTLRPRFSLPEPVEQAEWSPEGRLLAIRAGDGRLEIRDALSGELRATPPGGSMSQWHAGGRFYALRRLVDGREPRVFFWEAATGRSRDYPAARPLARVTVNPAGDRVLELAQPALWDDERPLFLTRLSPEGTIEARELVGFQQGEWSPDGRFIFTLAADRTGLLLNADGSVRARLGEPMTWAAWSPDGSRLLSSTNASVLRLWNGEDGRLLATIAAAGPDDWLVFTPEGYFHAAGEGYEWLRWRVGEEILPLERFRERFEDPERVREVLRGAGQTAGG